MKNILIEILLYIAYILYIFALAVLLVVCAPGIAINCLFE